MLIAARKDFPSQYYRFECWCECRSLGHIPIIGYVTFVTGVRAGDMPWMLALGYATVMTAHARANDGTMIYLRYWYPGIIVMAVFAGIDCINMGRMFTRGGTAIVTKDAGVRHPAMIKVHIAPPAGGMAIITGIGAGDMCRVLALGNAAIVAAHTATPYVCMIHPYRWTPGSIVMAVFTVIPGINMIKRLSRCSNSATPLMATNTLFRCPFKQTARVAAFTILVNMCTSKREPRGEVIEFKLILGAQTESQRKTEDGQYTDESCSNF
jgi:hypothetical protein